MTQVDPHVIPKALQAGGRRNRITALQGPLVVDDSGGHGSYNPLPLLDRPGSLSHFYLACDP